MSDSPPQPDPSKQLVEKITDALLKSGAVAELTAAGMATAADWSVTLSPTYQDRDRHISREYDLLAWRLNIPSNLVGHDIDSVVSLRIVGEVKRSKSKPWIVLGRDPYGNKHRRSQLYSGTPADQSLSDRADFLGASRSLECTMGWVGSGVREAFVAQNGKSSWYRAAVVALKASLSSLEDAARTFPSRSAVVREGPTRLQAAYPWPTHHLAVPTIILDGLLFGAVMEEKSLRLEPLRWAPVAFQYQSGGYREEQPCVLSIVTLEALPAFLRLCSERLDAMERHAELLRAATRSAIDGKPRG